MKPLLTTAVVIGLALLNARAQDSPKRETPPRGADDEAPGAIRERSPDGQFAVRYVYRSDDSTEPHGVPQRIELIRLPSNTAVLEFDLQNEQDDLSFSILWSPDSQRFATAMWIERIETLAAFQRAGATFAKCNLPEFAKYHPVLKKGYTETKFLSGGEEFARWESADVLLVKGFRNYMTDPRGIVEGKFHLRLRFAKDGKATVEKVLSRKVSGPAR